MLDSKDHSNIKFKRVNETTGVEVAYENIVKGYKLDSGYVILEEEDFEAAGYGFGFISHFERDRFHIALNGDIDVARRVVAKPTAFRSGDVTLAGGNDELELALRSAPVSTRGDVNISGAMGSSAK